jgi:hypothetical protein
MVRLRTRRATQSRVPRIEGPRSYRPRAVERPDHREVLGDGHTAPLAAGGDADHDQHVVADRDDLIEVLPVLGPGLARVGQPLERPLIALEDPPIPHVVELEVGVEPLLREGLEAIQVAALKRLVAAPEELGPLVHVPRQYRP